MNGATLPNCSTAITRSIITGRRGTHASTGCRGASRRLDGFTYADRFGDMATRSYTVCATAYAALSNGMDSSSPKRHLGARLDVLSTSREREGVHHEQA